MKAAVAILIFLQAFTLWTLTELAALGTQNDIEIAALRAKVSALQENQERHTRIYHAAKSAK